MTEINSLDAAPRRMTVLHARGSGKTLAMENWRRAHEEFERIMARTDQLHRMAAGWRIAPPQPPTPGIAGVRWACTSPTGYVSLSPMEEYWRNYTRGMVDGLAGRRFDDSIPVTLPGSTVRVTS